MKRKLSNYPTIPVNPRYNSIKEPVRWIDRELLESLIKRLGYSKHQFKLLISDTNGWIFKMGRSQSTMSYPNLRIAADILGVPVWFLAYGDKNSKFLAEFEGQQTDLPLLSVNLAKRSYSSIEHLKTLIKERGMSYSTQSEDLEALDRIQENLIRHDLDIERDFLTQLQKKCNKPLVHSDYPWFIRLYVGDEEASHSNIVFQYFAIPINKSERLFAAWMFAQFDHERPTLIKSLVASISEIFHLKAAEYTGHSPNFSGFNALYLWNSHYHYVSETPVIESEIKRLIQSNIPTADINSIQHLTTSVISNRHDQEMNDLVEWLATDGASDSDAKYIQTNLFPEEQRVAFRKTQTLLILVEAGYIQEGSQVEFIQLRDFSTKTVMTPRGRATLRLTANTVRLLWEEDGQLYSISRLSRILLGWPNRGVDGNFYWAKAGESSSLYKVAKEMEARADHRF